jgi:hypothetical protein
MHCIGSFGVFVLWFWWVLCVPALEWHAITCLAVATAIHYCRETYLR